MIEAKGSHLTENYARAPVNFVRGEGCELIDDRGDRYLDFVAGIAVCALGHAHPADHRSDRRAGAERSCIAATCTSTSRPRVWQMNFPGARASGEFSSATPVPKRRKRRSSLPASAPFATGNRHAGPSSPAKAASTAAPWERWPRLRTPSIKRGSSRFPAASHTCRSTTSRPSSGRSAQRPQRSS